MTLLPNFKPKQLPKHLDLAVAADTETSGLYPDSGARVSVVSLAWHEGSEIKSCAFPFWQGLVVRGQAKPEIEKADFGWLDYTEGPEIHGHYKNGNPKSKKIHRKHTLEEKLALLGPDPNLGWREWDQLVDWMLECPGLVWHNALFDVVQMGEGTPDFPGVDLLHHTVWDTMLGQRVLDGAEKLGLKDTMQRRFGIAPEARDALKDHLKERKFPTGGENVRYDLADWDVMEWYAAEDTELTIQLALDQYKRFCDGEASFERMQTLMDRMGTLARMEQRGLPYDAAQSLQWAQKLEARVTEMADIFPFNPTAPQATQFFFTAERTKKDKPCLGLDPIKKTDKGNPSLDSEVLDRLAEREVPWAKEFREYGLTKDSVSKYYRGYAEAIGADGRLRTRFRQLGTRAGRLSCERVNLQAIPHDHRLLAGGSAILGEAPSPRKLMREPQGFRVFTMDLKQAELRLAAERAQCAPMLEILFEERDPHGETAIALGLSQGPDDTTSKMDWFKARSVVAKRSNFSLIFGIGTKKFREDLRKQSGTDFGDKMVRQIHKDWNALYPEFRRAIDKYMALARRAGFTEIRGDVRRYYSELEMTCFACKKAPCRCRQEADDLHKAFNQHVQGNLGEFGQEWMVRANQHLLAAGLDDWTMGLLLQTHDSLTVMVPEELVHLVEECADIARAMWDEWFPGVPGGVDVHEGI
jgi:DNA polymerase I-like protein with 3'-5' exonuclease and polymerase domains